IDIQAALHNGSGGEGNFAVRQAGHIIKRGQGRRVSTAVQQDLCGLKTQQRGVGRVEQSFLNCVVQPAAGAQSARDFQAEQRRGMRVGELSFQIGDQVRVRMVLKNPVVVYA